MWQCVFLFFAGTVAALAAPGMQSDVVITSNIVCSSTNDDESFCEFASDGDYQTFWRSDDLLRNDEALLYLEFPVSRCVVEIRSELNFCGYFLDKVDDYHFKDRLADCRAYHSEIAVGGGGTGPTVSCGYSLQYIYHGTTNFSTSHNFFSITQREVELHQNIKAVKLVFRCHHSGSHELESVSPLQHINAIVREVAFTFDDSGEKCLLTSTATPSLTGRVAVAVTNPRQRSSALEFVFLVAFVVAISLVCCCCCWSSEKAR
jgi:hypothetical protein